MRLGNDLIMTKQGIVKLIVDINNEVKDAFFWRSGNKYKKLFVNKIP